MATIRMYCTLLCTLMTGVMHAQSPGYMGKHFQVYGLLEPAFALRTIHYDSESFLSGMGEQANVKAYGIELTPGFGAEYTLSTTVTAGINFRFINCATYSALYYNEAIDEVNPPAFFGEMDVKGMFTGFYLKFYPRYKHGVIAPIGRYHQFEYITGKSYGTAGDLVITNLDGYEYYGYVNNYSASDLAPQTTLEPLGFEKVKSSYLRYTFGSETVWFDALAVDYGIQFTLPLSFLMNDFAYSDEIAGNDAYYENVSNGAYTAFMTGLILRFGYFVF